MSTIGKKVETILTTTKLTLGLQLIGEESVFTFTFIVSTPCYADAISMVPTSFLYKIHFKWFIFVESWTKRKTLLANPLTKRVADHVSCQWYQPTKNAFKSSTSMLWRRWLQMESGAFATTHKKDLESNWSSHTRTIEAKLKLPYW